MSTWLRALKARVAREGVGEGIRIWRRLGLGRDMWGIRGWLSLLSTEEVRGDTAEQEEGTAEGEEDMMEEDTVVEDTAQATAQVDHLAKAGTPRPPPE